MRWRWVCAALAAAVSLCVLGGQAAKADPAPTTTTLTATPNPEASGQQVTLTATVTSPSGIPTGTVDFLLRNVLVGSGTLSGGVASISIVNGTGPGGALVNLTASYEGSAGFQSSTSPIYVLAVGRTVPTTTSLVGPTTIQAGSTARFVVTVSGGSSTPTGTITFKIDGIAQTSATLDGSGSASFVVPANLAGGPHTIDANYGGDSAHASSLGSTPITVTKFTTTTTLTGPTSVPFGTAATFQATVTGAGATPSGTVTFTVNGSSLPVRLVNGSAEFSTSSTLPVGSYTVMATYNEDAAHGTSSAQASLSVTQAVPTIVLSISPTPATVDQSFVLTATVSGSGAAPTGTVTFSGPGITGGTVSLASGVAKLGVALSTPGSYSFTAHYDGDGNYQEASSTGVNQLVNQAVPGITLTSSQEPSTAGQSVTFTATVRGTGVTPPTGTVTFYDGGTEIGTSPLSLNGKATFTTSLLSVAAHAITAVYGGDPNYTVATSETLAQDVGLAGTLTRVVSSVNPSVVAQAVTFTATVTPSSGTATGQVTFLDGSTVLGTVPLTGTTALYTTSALSAGPHSITAAYGGDANTSASTSPAISQTVNLVATQTTLTSSPNPSTFGQSVSFTATVTPDSGTAVGSVTFLDGSTSLGNVAVSGGMAIFTTSALSIATHAITAVYGGNTEFAASTSSVLNQNVIGNGQVILAVTTDSDDTFSFSSATAALNATVRTSSGAGQTPGITLPPGTYAVTMALPSGFGLASVRCSDSDSAGSTSAHSAKIVLQPLETVTCVFAALNSRKKTVEAIGAFMNRRNDLLVSNGPDGRRQIDRLLAASGNANQNEGTASQQPGSAFGTGSHLGGPTDGVTAGVPLAGLSGRADRSIASQLAVESSSTAGAASGPSPFAASASSDGATTMSFSTSLSQMMSYQSAANQKKVADGLSPASHLGGVSTPGPQPLPFDIWVEGHYGDFGDRAEHQSDSGRFGIVYLGADYVVSPWLLIGALVQYDDTDLTSHQDSYSVSGHGWMAGPYATMRLSQNVFLQGRAAWGTSNDTVSPYLTYKDNFSTSRWLVDGTLSGRWQWGPWQFNPSASLSYIDDRSEHYTDTLGVDIPGLNASLGQFKAGPEVSYAFQTAEGATLVPRASMEAIWNFAGSDPTADFGGTLAGPTGVRARAELGVGVNYLSGAGLDLSVSYDGIGAGGYHSTAGEGSIKLPFD